MKKALSIVLILALVFCLAACGDKAKVTEITDLNIPVPEDWIDNSESGYFFAPDYPNDTSNIYILESGYAPDFSKMNEKSLQKQLENQLTTEAGSPIELEIDSFSRSTLNGLPAIRLDLHGSADGVALRMTQLYINATNSKCISFTSAGDADWSSVFEDCISGMTFLTEELN